MKLESDLFEVVFNSTPLSLSLYPFKYSTLCTMVHLFLVSIEYRIHTLEQEKNRGNMESTKRALFFCLLGKFHCLSLTKMLSQSLFNSLPHYCPAINAFT